jgi:hypothetical protein
MVNGCGELMECELVREAEVLGENSPIYDSVYSYIQNNLLGPPLWSNGQSSWLQIRRPGFDSRHYRGEKKE